VRNASGLRWRVLRSEHEFAESADPLPAGQTLISESSEGHVCDRRVAVSAPYFYTVFVEDEQGLWERQVTVKLAEKEHLRWLRPSHEEQPQENATSPVEYLTGEVCHGPGDLASLYLYGANEGRHR